MDPSKLIEDMFRIERNLRWGKNKDLDYLDAIGLARDRGQNVWETIKRNLVEAVPFYFQDAKPDPVHVDFAEQLLQHKLLTPPYPSVLISSNLTPKVQFLCGVAREQLIVVTFSFFGSGQMPKDVSCPAYLCASVADFTADSPMINVCPILERAQVADMQTNGTWAFQTAASHLAMLLSKEIVDRVEPPPVKLNKKRAAAGKAPIPERHTILIRKGVGKASGPRSPSANRASPCMHWRRGHLRHLPNGVIKKIPPVVVNAREEAQPILKSYIIKKGEIL